MPNALILGSNTAVGAYLARLLHARGTAVFGVASPVGGDGIAALGIADSVNAIGFADAIGLAARLPDATLFAVNSGDATTAEQAAELFGAASADARLCHIADADALQHTPHLLDQARAITALRRDHGRRPRRNRSRRPAQRHCRSDCCQRRRRCRADRRQGP